MKEYNEQVVETLDDAGCIIANKNIIIDNLQARIAELEEENARLKAASFFGKSKDIHALAEMVLSDCGCSSLHWPLMEKVENRLYAFFDEQLAAEQLNNRLLREALEHCMADGDFDTDDARTSFKEGVKAFATPTSTEALDKHVTERVKEYGDEARRQMQHATKAVWQRDLAVEALEAIAGRRIFIDNLASNVDIAVMTLGTIKESEAK